MSDFCWPITIQSVHEMTEQIKSVDFYTGLQYRSINWTSKKASIKSETDSKVTNNIYC